MLKSKKSYAVSAVGVLVLFLAFLLYNSHANPSWGTLKLSDVLTIIGGLMFIVPFYSSSVRVKKHDQVPNNWIWQGLPVVGMVLVCVGLLIPNTVALFPLLSLPDLMYLIGCVLMLIIFVYPPASFNEEMIEENVDEIVDEDSRSHK